MARPNRKGYVVILYTVSAALLLFGVVRVEFETVAGGLVLLVAAFMYHSIRKAAHRG